MQAKSVKIIEMLKESGLSYREFAKTIGVDVSLVSLVLSGKRNPGIKFFEGLLEYCSTKGLDPNEYISIDTASAKFKIEVKNKPFCAG